jgi:hypothetical protein
MEKDEHPYLFTIQIRVSLVLSSGFMNLIVMVSFIFV